MNYSLKVQCLSVDASCASRTHMPESFLLHSRRLVLQNKRNQLLNRPQLVTAISVVCQRVNRNLCVNP